MGLSVVPSPADLSRCVHCGLCLENCPTYLETGYEAESPRGRIHLIQALNEGRVDATASYRQHLELCLVCRNCESVCPSGVPFGRIMETARTQLYERTPLPWRDRLFRRVAFHELLPHRGRLRRLFSILHVYQRSTLGDLVRKALPHGLAEAERLLPELKPAFTPRWEVYPPEGKVRYRVGMFTGCVMPYLYGDVHAATLRVLRHNGCEVHIPRAQVCCGALNVHGGEREVASELARANVRAFVGRGLDAVVVNSAGCGAIMKEYADLLPGEALVDDFADLVKDVSEFLETIDMTPYRRTVDRTVTLQDSCHLSHAQKIKTAPRSLLQAIPGVQLREMAHPDLCCGSAGLYMLTQPSMSLNILDTRMQELTATGAETIVTANPGCMMQLTRGIARGALKVDVKHAIQLVDEAYRS